MKTCIDLFLTFVKMGGITFGGGYAMIPIVEREVIKKRNWATMEEVMDYYTIAQVTPGVIAVNVSTFIGFKQKGLLGGVIATVGFVLPGITLIALIALSLRNFVDYPIVQHGFSGIRIAVGALIIDTVVKLLKGVFKDGKGLVIFILGFALSAVWSANPIAIIVAAGIAGFLLYGPKKTDLSKNKKDAV
ncbi:MAG: chromate transporter [Treponema sp.]|nr:chromate transporter [Treponema sp.]